MGWLEYSTAKAAAVAPPEHLGVNAAGQALAEGVEDRAVGVRVVRAVGMRMVRQLVHVAAQHLGRLKAQHARARPVDEGAVAIQVNAEHTLAGGLQQQLGARLDARAARLPEGKARIRYGNHRAAKRARDRCLEGGGCGVCAVVHGGFSFL
jgi:hypothetical protein